MSRVTPTRDKNKEKYSKRNGKGKTSWDEVYFDAYREGETWRDASGEAEGGKKKKKYRMKRMVEVGFKLCTLWCLWEIQL